MTKKEPDLALIRHRLDQAPSETLKDGILRLKAWNIPSIRDGRIATKEELETCSIYGFISHAREDIESLLEAVEERDQIIHDLMLDKDLSQHGVLPPQQAWEKVLDAYMVMAIIGERAHGALRHTVLGESDVSPYRLVEAEYYKALQEIEKIVNEWFLQENIEKKMEIHDIPVTPLTPDQVEAVNSIQPMDPTPGPEYD